MNAVDMLDMIEREISALGGTTCHRDGDACQYNAAIDEAVGAVRRIRAEQFPAVSTESGFAQAHHAPEVKG